MSDANSGRATTRAQPESNVTTLVNGFGPVSSNAGQATYGPIPGAARDDQLGRPTTGATENDQAADSTSNGRNPLQVPVWDPPAQPTRPEKLTWRERLGLGKKDAVEAAPGPAAMRLADAQQSNATRDTDQGAGQVETVGAAQLAPVDRPGASVAPPSKPVPPLVAPTAGAQVPPPAASIGPTAAQPFASVPPPIPAPLVPPLSTRVTDRSDDFQRPVGPTADGSPTAIVPAVVVPVAGAATTAKPDEPVAVGQPRPQPGAARRTRKARLRLSRLDPWSVMKTSFMFSIAAGIMLVVAVYVVWTVLGTSGLFESVNGVVADVLSAPNDTTPFRIQDYVNTQKVMGISALIACVDVVIFTALATLASFLYNLAATMLGGLEITLAED